MKKRIASIVKLTVSAGLLFATLPLFAGTEITVTPGGVFTAAGLEDIAQKIQDVSDSNGPAMANALLLANLSGYSLGNSGLGGFPHFFVGISFNLGLAHLKARDSSYDKPKYYFPVLAPNPVIYAGVGLTPRLDIIGKIFIYSSGFYMPPVKYSYATLTLLNLYSLGGRIRYRLVESAVILPGLFNFGGVSIAAGGDFMSGVIKLEGAYNYPLGTVDTFDLEFRSSYTAKTKWYIGSIAAQITAYIDIFWIFSFYSGFGLSLNYGTFELHANGSGPAYDKTSSTIVGDITASSNNVYRTKYFTPLFLLGAEINLYVIRLTVESALDLANRQDINLQFGTRYQF